MLEPVAIVQFPGLNVSKVVAPTEPGFDVVAHEVTGSVQPSAPAAGISVANPAIEKRVALPAARTVQRSKARKIFGRVAQPKAPAYTGWTNTYVQKPVPPPKFTNSGY